MKRSLTKHIVAWGGILAIGLSVSAFAAPTPVGYWKTIDDETKNPKGLMHIYKDKSGKLIGMAVGGFKKSGDKSLSICSQCSSSTFDSSTGYGLKKDEKTMGKIIMWNYSQNGSKWTGGSVVNTADGKKYSSDISLDPNNSNILDVVGKVFIFTKTH